MQAVQKALLCGCGNPISLAGFCTPCYRSHRLSLNHFGGLRESVLVRDGRRCQTCASLEDLLVHHRRRINRMRFLITECRRCHPKIHRTLRPRYGFPIALRALWREQHVGLAEQLELEFTVVRCSLVQVRLFEAV